VSRRAVSVSRTGLLGSTGALADWLAAARVPVVDEVEPGARLTRHIRSKRAMRGAVALGVMSRSTPCVTALAASPSMDGLDLATEATIGAEYTEGPAEARRHIVAYDYGMKRNILRLFLKNGCRVTVVPAANAGRAHPRARTRRSVPLETVPGDPAAVSYAIATLRDLADGSLPIFGICLGHQLARVGVGGGDGQAPLRASRGNHPVRDLATGQVLITSQNHGFRGPGRIPAASPVPTRLRSRTLTSTTPPSKGQAREYPIFAVCSIIPRPHRDRTTPKATSNRFLQALTLQ